MSEDPPETVVHELIEFVHSNGGDGVVSWDLFLVSCIFFFVFCNLFMVRWDFVFIFWVVLGGKVGRDYDFKTSKSILM